MRVLGTRMKMRTRIVGNLQTEVGMYPGAGGGYVSAVGCANMSVVQQAIISKREPEIRGNLTLERGRRKDMVGRLMNK